MPRRAIEDSLNLDSPFDRLTALACAMFDARHAMIGIVDGDRTLFRSNVGLGQSELPRDLSVTNMMIDMGHDALFVVEDGLIDPRVVNHPMVTGAPFLRFFVGVTISNADGRAIGAMGVMDTRPRARPTQSEIESLRLLARMAGDSVDRADLMARQSERLELLRLAEEMAGVGQWRLDAATMKVTWSDEVYRIHGVERGGFDPSYDDAVSFYHPEDRAPLMAAIDKGLSEGVGYRFTLRLIRKDGTPRLVETHAECERGPDGRVTAMFGVFRDVTEEEESRRRVADSERRYRLLAANATDIIATYGLDGVFTYISPAIEGLLGYDPDELVGRAFADFMHPEDVAAVRMAFNDYAKAGPDAASPRVPYRGIHKDGREVWLEAHPKVIRDIDGRPIEFQDIVRDVSDRKRLEDELVEARDRAEAGARAKAEFLANMSHELRTPLTSVIGFAGLLKDSPNLPERERGQADRIATASDSLLSVINDILDYSKLEAGRVEMEPLPFEPRALAEAAAAMIEGVTAAKGLSLTTVVDEQVPTWLTGDVVRLRQVVLNFLSNAAKFTTKGDVELRLGWADDRLKVQVGDSGIGIPEARIDALFERFTQADASTTRVYGGTGLGLSISRRLVEMMGGDIGARSRLGEGSTFWFEVPAPEAVEIQGAPACDAEAAPTDLRVLVADDAPANRELVSAILGGFGLVVEVVEDGAQAVEAARTGAYDLILMDVHMPVMDGLDATRTIRAMGGAVGATPIVALTANVQPEQVARCREAGMDAHVGKPIQVAELLRTMAAVTTKVEPEGLRSAG